MKSLQKAFLLALLLSYTSAYALSLEDIQGVMLQRISSFITWPSLPDQAMRVCVVGDKNQVENLQQLYHNKKLHGLPIEVIAVKATSGTATLTSCQIIFFVDNISSMVTGIVDSAKTVGQLLVSGNEKDIYKGATVALYPDNNKFKIVINKNSLQNQKLKADYRLMKLAEVVENPVKNHAPE